MELKAHNISVDVPSGWDASIYKRQSGPGELTFPILHATNFPLPQVRGDFGGGVVELMGADSIMVVLFEYGPQSVGQPLFQAVGIPNALRAGDFKPEGLRRRLQGQAGLQRFFQESGRAFSLYAVIGSVAASGVLSAQANGLLKTLSIESIGW